MILANKKANFYIDEDILQTIDEICFEQKITGRGLFIKELVEKYIQGEILQSQFEKEVLSTLRQNKKMLSELLEIQLVTLNVLNTICELNDYDNFISMDERKTYAISEAEKYLRARKNAEIVKNLENRKLGQSTT
ncbi:hypothetical protein D2A86_10125 [Enterococcus faecalis]|nr:hypothetical protein [Enterococcus faecalis]EGO9005202.1 hypothetical protein [Enterococcus faecalis]EGO9160562.1 hypothetical protein [Enterococcus faecalis]EHL2494789.1 hypothetical protein [Enterococcus faecalis]EKJ3575742.1 hypothetical protein [Enterococcus faecalis]